MSFKNKGFINEKLLFHGTRETDPKQIYMGEVGFDCRFSSKGKWGQANYFAEDANFADKYAHVPSEGLKQLLVAKVLVGNSYFSIPDNTLRLPPILSTNTIVGNLLFSEFRYDTITGFSKGHSIYMTYDNCKSYPLYILSYFQ